MNWSETNVLVTGASRGLGAALGRGLSRRGAGVFLVSREEEALRAVVDPLKRGQARIFAHAADIGNKEAIYPLVAHARDALGHIDVVVHNAGTLGPSHLRPLAETDCEDLESAFATHVLGPFRLTKALVGAMTLRGAGRVVFVSSDAATTAYASWGAYGASKAAADHLARIWAEEIPELSFISVDPGEMDTKMHRDALPDADRSALRAPEVVADKFLEVLSRANGRQGRIVLFPAGAS